MINLLPPETRENILYARRNTKLLRWSGVLMLGIVGIALVVAFGHFYIDQNTNNVNKQVAQTKQELKDQKLEETQKRVQSISGSLKLVTQVLSQQILFSKLLKQVGAVMPSDTSLAGLSINEVSGGIDLQAVAVDYQSASQVQVNLQDPKNKLFEKVDILSVGCGEADAGEKYPCTGSYRALFTEDNPFKFLTSQKEAP